MTIIFDVGGRYDPPVPTILLLVDYTSQTQDKIVLNIFVLKKYFHHISNKVKKIRRAAPLQITKVLN